MGKDIKYIVKLNMVSTQDCVRPYTQEVEFKSLKEARNLIKDLVFNYKKAFNKYYIGSEYDYKSVENKIYKVITNTIELNEVRS